MRLLLDTHTLLWALLDDPVLRPDARDLIADPANLVVVSPVSVWEVGIKQALGKLDAPGDLEAQVAHARFTPLPITFAHAAAAGALPRHHDDPFDRMLIAQAGLEGLTVVTRDRRFAAYDVPLLAA